MGDVFDHLALRTHFGANVQDAQKLRSQKTIQRALSQMIAESQKAPEPKPPNFAANTLEMNKGKLSKDERQKRRKMFRAQGLELKLWWLTQMRNTKTPLVERMTLFWHNHFTSSLRKVRAPQLMLLQNQTFRKHALGHFDDLLRAMLNDPALLLYLDNQKNRKKAPNENLARELLELFTIGISHYSESDVKNIARALTGLGVNRRSQEVVFRRGQHDQGVKTVLGQSGRFGADEIVKILLAHDETSRFVVKKVWRAFIDDVPQNEWVNTWAAQYKNSRYDTARLLNTVLSSAPFLRCAQKGTLIKSPLDLVIGSLRSFNVNVPDRFVIRTLKRLGQDVFDPPNVRGWVGGRSFITSSSLSMRKQFLARVLEQHDIELQENKSKTPRVLLATTDDDARANLLSPLFQVM